MVPMGGSHEVYTNLEKEKIKFSYWQVRKATYRGSEPILNIPIILNYQHYISIQVLCDLGNIPKLVC